MFVITLQKEAQVKRMGMQGGTEVTVFALGIRRSPMLST